ncbi:uncharacterized protein [Nicotiana sylvestris]|uniref:uncharacterized protein n=1 Tax=Nicotiana sylvestris TaxID=4096 RepID=UPI00388C7BCD
MVRTRTTRDDQAPAPPLAAARGRGRGRGRGRARGVARAPARAVAEAPPVDPARTQAPDTPTTTTTPVVQEALAQFMSMYTMLSQAGLLPLPAATSQAGGRAQTRAARTPEQRVHMGQIPDIIHVQPAVPVQPEDGAPTSEDEQRRLERFKKYDPPVFSGLAIDDALGFLEDCHYIFRTMGITASSGVSFAAFQLRGAAYDWWRTFELDSLDEAASLTWTQFSDMFQREFVPQSLRNAWRAEFEHFRQGPMTVSEYAIRYTRLARHALALVATVRERVRQFIKGLIPSIRSGMARELEMDIPYQQVVSIARRIEGMHSREREEREAKRSRESGHYTGTRTSSVGRHSRGYTGRPVHSALPSSSSTPAPPRSHEPYYAPPVSSAPPARGTSRVRDCPRLGRSAPPQHSQQQRTQWDSQAIVPAPATTPPAQPTRDGDRGDRGRPRGRGRARFYAIPDRAEAVASDSVITCIILVSHREASVLFNPGSTYSYVSSYFAPHLGTARETLSSPVYVSTPVRDSLVLDRVYRSCLVTIRGFDTRADLLLLDMVDFDIILGMDWLLPQYAILDCHAKTVMLAMPGIPRIEWSGTFVHTPSRVISFRKAQRMVEKGCAAYLDYVRDVSADTPSVDSVPVVRDFSDVFPVDLPGMPPDRDIDFGIDLLPGT